MHVGACPPVSTLRAAVCVPVCRSVCVSVRTGIGEYRCGVGVRVGF